jgi:hypothetical protein
MTLAANKSFRYAAIALKVLEKVLGSKFTVNGIENLPNQPILFVSNHFTRFETFVVPYLIYKNTGRQVRCLADSGLYYGTLGKFLNSVGTISTKNINRDNIILKDLITAQHDWMIYPEGSMIKSKETKKGSSFINYTPDRVGHVRTGSSVLALKSQLYRDDIVEAFDLKKTDVLEEFKKSQLEYIKYLQKNGPGNFDNVSKIETPISGYYWGTDDELFYISLLYNCWSSICNNSSLISKLLLFSELFA